MYAERIINFGGRFKGRLDSVLTECALDYVEYSEEGLAFDILCDYICEHDVSITVDGYDEAIRLALDMGFDINKGPFKHLKGLVS